MVDELKSNLEPIGEEDLNLESKFREEAGSIPGVEPSLEVPNSPEVNFEKKEKAVEKEAVYSQILSKVKAAHPTDDQNVEVDARTVSESADTESRIIKLVEIAQLKGVVHAVKVARHLEDNYVLDELHDRLLGDELHQALIQKGLLKDL